MTKEQNQFARQGYLWLRDAVSTGDLQNLKDLSASVRGPGSRVARSDPLFQAVADLPVARQIAKAFPGQRPVRLLSFDKSDGSNWAVPWHQDRIIATATRADVAGFGNWSQKSGTWHCEPPEALLQNMLFVRLHIDPSTVENGAMEIAEGSHLRGILPGDQAAEVATRHKTWVTTAKPGDVLILHMLTLHRSGRASDTGGRAALRIDFSPDDLPAPLAWADQI
ncbi:phytanoyl-CoA dioxygenase family protein [Roseovarius sp. 2305UL8-3]|uniref:phytanoyl-CoA dioxygenase family protein n=1 Tax=Roseovarius conchicola TaxID=3121636 RepID=UPI003527263A